MTEPGAHEDLIRTLCGELRPVRPLHSPWLRALAFLAAVGAFGAATVAFEGGGTIARQFAAPLDACAAVGAAATAVLAAFAAFLLSVPDRRPEWALLPMPALALWLLASGLGCLGTQEAVPTPDAHAPHACFTFIVGVSLPLSVLLFLMLRRAYSVRPNLTATLGGLAVAAAAATLLEFFHPFDVTVLDLLAHVAAVLAVIGANRYLSGHALRAART